MMPGLQLSARNTASRCSGPPTGISVAFPHSSPLTRSWYSLLYCLHRLCSLPQRVGRNKLSAFRRMYILPRRNTLRYCALQALVCAPDTGRPSSVTETANDTVVQRKHRLPVIARRKSCGATPFIASRAAPARNRFAHGQTVHVGKSVENSKSLPSRCQVTACGVTVRNHVRSMVGRFGLKASGRSAATHAPASGSRTD